MTESPPLLATVRQILRDELPNLFRLYLNPYVAQTCFCLGRYVQDTWHRGEGKAPTFQSFLANGFDEALSGAIKLARYCRSLDGRPTLGLVIDPTDRLGPFASAQVGGGAIVEFVPGLVVINRADNLRKIMSTSQRFGFVVLVAGGDPLDEYTEALRELARRDAPLVITSVVRASL